MNDKISPAVSPKSKDNQERPVDDEKEEENVDDETAVAETKLEPPDSRPVESIQKAGGLGGLIQRRPPGMTSTVGASAQAFKKPESPKTGLSHPAIQKRPPGSTNLASIMGKSEQHQRVAAMMKSSSHKKAEFIEIKGRPPAESI